MKVFMFLVFLAVAFYIQFGTVWTKVTLNDAGWTILMFSIGWLVGDEVLKRLGKEKNDG